LSIRNYTYILIDFDFVGLLSRFLGIVGSSFTPTLRGEKNRVQLAGELGAAKINLHLLGFG
jgi:hypothetical protein